MTKQIKHNRRSEAAQREGCKALGNKTGYIAYQIEIDEKPFYLQRWELAVISTKGHGIIAIFDLRDCYRKRAPLKGINKAFKKAIQPKRKK